MKKLLFLLLIQFCLVLASENSCSVYNPEQTYSVGDYVIDQNGQGYICVHDAPAWSGPTSSTWYWDSTSQCEYIAPTLTPEVGTEIVDTFFTISWDHVDNVSGYKVWVGSSYDAGDLLVAGGENNLHTSYNVSAINRDVEKIYVRLDVWHVSGVKNVRTVYLTSFTPIDTTNNPPIDIQLSSSKVDQDAPVGTFIGTFSSNDVDDSVHAYSLVEGDNDNYYFAVRNDSLFTNDVFSYFSQNEYNIEVKSTDLSGGFLTKIMTIAILDGQSGNNGSNATVKTVIQQEAENSLSFKTIITNISADPISNLKYKYFLNWADHNGPLELHLDWSNVSGVSITTIERSDYIAEAIFSIKDYVIPSGGSIEISSRVNCVGYGKMDFSNDNSYWAMGDSLNPYVALYCNDTLIYGDEPDAPFPPKVDYDVSVVTKSQQESSNSISLQAIVKNNSLVPVNDVKFSYFLDARDHGTSKVKIAVDWSQVPELTSKVIPGLDSVIEAQFSLNDHFIPAGSERIINFRLHLTDYKTMDFSNDFSYDGIHDTNSNDKLFVSVSGIKVGGTSPYEQDTDGDGFTDIYEKINGTDPFDATSFPVDDNGDTAGVKVNQAVVDTSSTTVLYYNYSGVRKYESRDSVVVVIRPGVLESTVSPTVSIRDSVLNSSLLSDKSLKVGRIFTVKSDISDSTKLAFGFPLPTLAVDEVLPEFLTIREFDSTDNSWRDLSVDSIRNGTAYAPISARATVYVGYNFQKKRMSAGKKHLVMIDSASKVHLLGSNKSGQLGGGIATDENITELYQNPFLDNIVQVEAGDYHTLALDKHGNVWAWGANHKGQVGVDPVNADVVSTPTMLNFAEDIICVAAGSFHSLAITTAGEVYTWGSNTDGQLGFGDYNKHVFTPTKLPNVKKIVLAAAGRAHSFVMQPQDTIWTWGSNNRGQLWKSFSGDKSVDPCVLIIDSTKINKYQKKYHSPFYATAKGDVSGIRLVKSGGYRPVYENCFWGDVTDKHFPADALGTLPTWYMGSIFRSDKFSIGESNILFRWSFIKTISGPFGTSYKKTVSHLYGNGTNFNGEINRDSTQGTIYRVETPFSQLEERQEYDNDYAFSTFDSTSFALFNDTLFAWGKRAKDSVIQKIGNGKPAVVEILFPKEGAQVKYDSIDVIWSIGGVNQTEQLFATDFVHGANKIVRTYKGVFGEVGDSVLVHYDSLTPQVKIINPATDTTYTNYPYQTITYKVNDVDTTTSIELNGDSLVIVSVTDTLTYKGAVKILTGSDSVYYVLDTIPPSVEIEYPKDGDTIKVYPFEVFWQVDGVIQDHNKAVEPTLGLNTLIRNHVDKAGNKGADTIQFYFDYGPPVLTQSYFSAEKNIVHLTYNKAITSVIPNQISFFSNNGMEPVYLDASTVVSLDPSYPNEVTLQISNEKALEIELLVNAKLSETGMLGGGDIRKFQVIIDSGAVTSYDGNSNTLLEYSNKRTRTLFASEHRPVVSGYSLRRASTTSTDSLFIDLTLDRAIDVAKVDLSQFKVHSIDGAWESAEFEVSGDSSNLSLKTGISRIDAETIVDSMYVSINSAFAVTGGLSYLANTRIPYSDSTIEVAANSEVKKLNREIGRKELERKISNDTMYDFQFVQYIPEVLRSFYYKDWLLWGADSLWKKRKEEFDLSLWDGDLYAYFADLQTKNRIYKDSLFPVTIRRIKSGESVYLSTDGSNKYVQSSSIRYRSDYLQFRHFHGDVVVEPGAVIRVDTQAVTFNGFQEVNYERSYEGVSVQEDVFTSVGSGKYIGKQGVLFPAGLIGTHFDSITVTSGADNVSIGGINSILPKYGDWGTFAYFNTADYNWYDENGLKSGMPLNGVSFIDFPAYVIDNKNGDANSKTVYGGRIRSFADDTVFQYVSFKYGTRVYDKDIYTSYATKQYLKQFPSFKNFFARKKVDISNCSFTEFDGISPDKIAIWTTQHQYSNDTVFVNNEDFKYYIHINSELYDSATIHLETKETTIIEESDPSPTGHMSYDTLIVILDTTPPVLTFEDKYLRSYEYYDSTLADSVWGDLAVFEYRVSDNSDVYRLLDTTLHIDTIFALHKSVAPGKMLSLSTTHIRDLAGNSTIDKREIQYLVDRWYDYDHDFTITNGDTTLVFKDLTIDSCTIICGDTLKAKTIRVKDKGKLVVRKHIECDVLILEDSSVVTGKKPRHGIDTTGLSITANRVVIDSTSSIDVSDQGYHPGYTNKWTQYSSASNDLALGGVHASHGEYHYNNKTLKTYGDMYLPVSLGSGGLNNAAAFGGGAIKIKSMYLENEGRIVANSSHIPYGGYYNSRSGGAGGSVFIDVDSLFGSGLISASAGFGGSTLEVTGGAGRIAIYCDSVYSEDMFDNLKAHGNSCGTIYLNLINSRQLNLYSLNPKEITGRDTTGITLLNASILDSSLDLSLGMYSRVRLLGENVLRNIDIDTSCLLILDKATHKCNTITVSYNSELRVNDSLYVGSLLLDSGAIVSHDEITINTILDFPKVSVIAEKEIIIPHTAKVDVSEKGYMPGYTYKGLSSVDSIYFGGSHGGLGYQSPNGVRGIYGSAQAPSLPGAGGGIPKLANLDKYQWHTGGGVIKLNSPVIHLDGEIIANGGHGRWNSTQGYGGGAGGSIHIVTDSLLGQGSIQAAGNLLPDSSRGLRGGGGRVAIYSPNISPQIESSISVDGYNDGTIYVMNTTTSGKSVDISSGSHSFQDSSMNIVIVNDKKDDDSVVVEFNGKNLIGNLYVKEDITLIINDTLFADSVFLDSGSIVQHRLIGANKNKFAVKIVANYIQIDSGAAINTTGLGYIPGQTYNGAHNLSDIYGASHGGLGNYEDTALIYGNKYKPTLPGAGSGGTPKYYDWGNGGGCIYLAAKKIINNGIVVADGVKIGGGGKRTGGGAGGSIWIDADTITGIGSISASSYSYYNFNQIKYLQGGGGRIAIYCDTISDSLLHHTYVDGHMLGTIYLEKATEGYSVIKSREDTRKQNSTLNIDSLENSVIVKDHYLEIVGNELKRLSILEDGQVEFNKHMFIDTLTIDSGGVLTHKGLDEINNSNKLDITSELIKIKLGAKISTDAKGYRCGLTPNGECVTRTTKSGGYHIREGAKYEGCGIYGDSLFPVTHGSGGGQRSNDWGDDRTYAGFGGGVVRIFAKRIDHDGEISCAGLRINESSWNSSDTHGNGAGGSILIFADTLVGEGRFNTQSKPLSDTVTFPIDTLLGSGGMVAIYTNSDTMTLKDQINVSGFIDGTIHLGSFDDVPKARVHITSPYNNSFTNVDSVEVRWSVDGYVDDSSSIEHLVEGENFIFRYYIEGADTLWDTVMVTLDTQMPVVGIIEPVDSAAVSTDFTVIWTVDGVEKEKLYAIAPLTVGYNEIVIEEVDLAGNWGRDTITVHKVASPLLEIISPVSGTTLNDSIVSINWSLDGIHKTLDTTLYEADSPCTVSISGVNQWGLGVSDTVVYYIDYTAPVIELIDSMILNDTIVLDSGLLTVDYISEGVAYTFDTLLTEGQHKIKLTAVDSANNIGLLEAEFFVKYLGGSTGAYVKVVSPEIQTDDLYPDFIIKVVASNNELSTKSSTIEIDGVNVTDSFVITENEMRWINDSYKLEPGPHRLIFSVTDAADSINYHIHSFTIDNVTASFSVSTNQGEVPLIVQFRSDVWPANDWRWDFEGDGAIDTTTDMPGIVNYTFTDTGVYYPTLELEYRKPVEVPIIDTLTGDQKVDPSTGDPLFEIKEITQVDTQTAKITVLPPKPDVQVIAYPQTGAVPHKVNFSGWANTSHGYIKTHLWDLDADGTFEHSFTVAPDTLFSSEINFETGLLGWSPDGITGSFEHVVSSGDSLWSTNSDGNMYVPNMQIHMTSPEITVPSDLTTCSLVIDHSIKTESTYDFGDILVDSGDGFKLLKRLSGAIGQETLTVSLADYIGKPITVRLLFNSDHQIEDEGWQVKSVIVEGTLADNSAQVVFTDNFKNDLGWTLNNGKATWTKHAVKDSFSGDGAGWIVLNDTGSSDCWITSDAISLPSNPALLDLTVKSDNRSNNAGFTLQASKDGVNFTTLTPITPYWDTLFDSSLAVVKLDGTTVIRYDMADYVNEMVHLRVHYKSNETSTTSGLIIEKFDISEVVAADIPPVKVLFENDFESSIAGWTDSSANSVSGWGIDSSSHFGISDTVWSTNIDDVYKSNMHIWMVSPSFTVDGHSELSFWQILNTEQDFDYGVVEIDTNMSGEFTLLKEYTGAKGYSEESISLGAYAGQTVRIRFAFSSDEAVEFGGWHVGDIKVASSGVEQFNGLTAEWTKQWPLDNEWKSHAFSFGSMDDSGWLSVLKRDSVTYGDGLHYLTSPSVTLSEPLAVLTFDHIMRTTDSTDKGWVEISVNGESYDTLIPERAIIGDSVIYDSVTYSGWNNRVSATYELSKYLGHDIRIRFVFDANHENNAGSWLIDNVKIESKTGSSVSNVYNTIGTVRPGFKVIDNLNRETFCDENSMIINTVQKGAPTVNAFVSETKLKSVPHEVFFDAAWTTSTGVVASIQWDYDGDGFFDSLFTENAKTKFTYTKSGVYYPTIKVIDSEGKTATDTKEIIIAFADPQFSTGNKSDNKITFTLSGKAKTTLFMKNTLGDTVAVLLNDTLLLEGNHTQFWSGIGLDGENVPSGVYYAILELNYGSGTEVYDYTFQDIVKPKTLLRFGETSSSKDIGYITSADYDKDKPFKPYIGEEIPLAPFLIKEAGLISYHIGLQYWGTGKWVRTICSRKPLPAGTHEFTWDGYDDNGEEVSLGTDAKTNGFKFAVYWDALPKNALIIENPQDNIVIKSPKIVHSPYDQSKILTEVAHPITLTVSKKYSSILVKVLDKETSKAVLLREYTQDDYNFDEEITIYWDLKNQNGNYVDKGKYRVGVQGVLPGGAIGFEKFHTITIVP